VEDTIDDAEVEDVDDTEVVEQPSAEEIEDLEVDVEPDDSSAVEEMWKLDFEDEKEEPSIDESEIEEIDLEEAKKLEEKLSDFDAEEELPEVEDEDRMTD
jgi:hypothetical protein